MQLVPDLVIAFCAYRKVFPGVFYNLFHLILNHAWVTQPLSLQWSTKNGSNLLNSFPDFKQTIIIVILAAVATFLELRSSGFLQKQEWTLSA